MKMRHIVSTVFTFLGVLLISVNGYAGGSRDRVSELKELILEIANNARGEFDNEDNSAEARAALDPLVDELVSLVPQKTETKKLPLVVGSWKQVWSDGPGGGPPGSGGTLADSVFQVVFPDGYYWNIGKNQVGETKSMGYLRGKFTIDVNKLDIEFTKSVGSPGCAPDDTESYLLAMQAETGAFDSMPTPGPIGKKGFLANTYVDEDLRICRGGGDDFGTGTYLYILERESEL
ncbi:PAP/fibrillin family protein [Bdellovibrio sp. HCB274]|uniref:PAP/fibrillin family protein n=1 Tax=Bdellovibrio sp. HCB274 TaxID=3394361 RepID=UPI0039B4D2AD